MNQSPMVLCISCGVLYQNLLANDCMEDKRDIKGKYFIIVFPLRHCDAYHLHFWQAEFLSEISCVFCYYY